MTAPEISVVMSVYNGAEHLHESIDSVLSQEGVDFEFIIVDDGSRDESGRILDQYDESDSRVKVIHQENRGLTQSLIRGCAEARGEYIARQDAGDISLPGRLLKQIEWIKGHPATALVSCGTKIVGPCGEHLYDVRQDPADATDRLLTVDLRSVKGPSHHGCTLFPSSLYKKVGGYRPFFYFAQDLDLWVRLAEVGVHGIIPKVLYQTCLSVGTISNIYRKEQIKTARIILECARLRRSGLSELSVLEKAGAIRPSSDKHIGRLDHARALYFIASCLKEGGNPQSKNYFWQAVMKFPLHLKSVVRLLLG